jgi:hypothetical protein
MEQGEAQRAANYVEGVLGRIREFGHRAAEGTACALLGDAYRDLEDFERSRLWCERAVESFRARGNEASILVVDLNMLVADMMRGAFDGADERLRDLHKRVEAIGATGRLRFVYACEMVLAASAADEERLGNSFARLRADLDASQTLMRDVPVLVERAAELADEASLGESAIRVIELAAELWTQYGDHERATEVAALAGGDQA